MKIINKIKNWFGLSKIKKIKRKVKPAFIDLEIGKHKSSNNFKRAEELINYLEKRIREKGEDNK